MSNPDANHAALRDMVKEIGSEPFQDAHFDYWSYAGQSIWGHQRYAQAIIRKYVQLKGGSSPPLALTVPMDLFMAECMKTP